mgnify:CR=1 FL=1|tara:strand:+ start:141 stop:722 length:582 start_codon:yes stop_codon:yes gene_type:complete
MVSLASEQWPDTVLPSVETIEPHENTRLTLRIAPEHLFLAWEQLSLELAKIPCEVVCQFKPNPIQKTIFYGSRVMPLRISEVVHKCNVLGFVKSPSDAIDVITKGTFRGNRCGWRVNPTQIYSVEIRTTMGSLVLKNDVRTLVSDWFCLPMADELSCWLWSVSTKENTRSTKNILESLVTSGQITDRMINILK